ncbi:uncharacterized protein LOC135129757 [Zophobas morio]|uniref:uncharacterized protein LOC135129757 n=1 Tax=Zophobas morio TaxID=2755281 RepID=UPI003083B9E3
MFGKVVVFGLLIPLIFATNLLLDKISSQDGFSLNYFLRDQLQLHLVLHFDNATKVAANLFLMTLSASLTLVNHDIVNNQPNLEQQCSVKYLHLVLLSNPLTFSKLCTSDFVVFFTNPTNFPLGSENFSSLSGLEKSGGVAVVNYAESVELYTICFYCGDIKGKMTLLQKSSYDQPLDIEFLFSNKFKNFGGHLFKVAYIDYLPYIYCSQKTRVNNITLCKKATGSEFLLLQTLSQHLNFTYQLIETPSDFFDILIDEVILKNADFAIGGVSITNQRMKSVKFGALLRLEPLCLLYVFQKPFLSKLFEYELKNLLLELFLLVVMFFLSLVVFFLDKCKLSFVDIFMMFLKSKYEINTNIKTSRFQRMQNSILVIFVSWWIFALIVNVIYRSMLVSLIFEKPLEDVTFQDLVDQGYQIVLKKNTSYMKMFLDTEERLINRSTTLWLDKCEMFPYVQNNKALVPVELTMNLVQTVYHCSTLRHTIIDVKKFTNRAFGVTPHAWAFKSDAPFIDEFNVVVKKLLNGAVLKMWENNVLLEKHMHTEYAERSFPRREKNVIDFESFILHFLVYLVLTMLSIFCFLFELLYWYLRKRNTVVVLQK